MKIIHIITALGIGGAEKLLVNTVNQQVKTNEVHVIYLKPINKVSKTIDKKIILTQIDLSLFTVKYLNKYFNKTNPDIIHTHLGHADFLGLFAGRKSNAKLFCTMHNISFKQNFLDIIFYHIYKFLFSSEKHPIRVISISKSVEKHVIGNLKLAEKRSYLLYNAIPDIPIKKKINKDNVLNLLFIGRLEKQKSIETLLKAISHLKNENIRLTLVGDGSLKSELLTLSKKLNIHNLVCFVGLQEHTEEFYEKADVFILPSIWEGFGIVILEAFRAKIPVIGSNIEGPAELIENNKNGMLFTPKNDIELAKKIRKLITNEKLRNKLGENGFKTFKGKFKVANYVKKLNQLYING